MYSRFEKQRAKSKLFVQTSTCLAIGMVSGFSCAPTMYGDEKYSQVLERIYGETVREGSPLRRSREFEESEESEGLEELEDKKDRERLALFHARCADELDAMPITEMQQDLRILVVETELWHRRREALWRTYAPKEFDAAEFQRIGSILLEPCPSPKGLRDKRR